MASGKKYPTTCPSSHALPATGATAQAAAKAAATEKAMMDVLNFLDIDFTSILTGI